MSEFVNLNLTASRQNTQDAVFSANTNGGDILVVPSQYSVGVNRFKIPLSSIPVYKIYEQDMGLCIMNNGIGKFNATTCAEVLPSGLSNRINVLDLSALDISYGRYKIDFLNNNQKCIEFSSQEEILKHMNQALARAYSNMGLRNQTTTNINTPIGATNCGNGTITGNVADGITQIATFNINLDNSNNGVQAGRLLTELNLRLDTIASAAGAGGAVADFSNFDFFIRRLPIDNAGNADAGRLTNGDSNTWWLNNNVLKGLSANNNGGNTQLSLNIGISPLHHIDIQDCPTSDLFNSWVSNVNAGNVAGKSALGCPLLTTSTDPNAILGKRADGYSYTLFCRNRVSTGTNNANLANVAGLTITGNLLVRTISASSVETRISNNNAQLANLQTQYLCPRFNMDNGGRFGLTIQSRYVLDNRFDIWMNENLLSIFSFERYRTLNTNSSNNYNRFFLDPNNFFNLNEDYCRGNVLTFSGNVESYTNIQPRNSLDNTFTYFESFDSSFVRDLLNSVIITTGRLAVDGEFIQNGQGQRKVLTDFEIDPSDTRRDYLLFSNSGGMRFYALKSDTPIKQVDASIFYLDIFGIVRPLEVKPYEECSLKIEFRPNNAIYSQTSAIDTFNMN